VKNTADPNRQAGKVKTRAFATLAVAFAACLFAFTANNEYAGEPYELKYSLIKILAFFSKDS